MDNFMTGSIPMKPHLAKFVWYKENLEPGEILFLKNKKSPICLYIYENLTGKSNISHYTPESDLFMRQRFSTNIIFHISVHMHNSGKFIYNKNRVSAINKFVDALFHEELLTLILHEVRSDEPKAYRKVKRVIYDFMERLNIENDVTFDQIKQANFRLRKRRKYPDIRKEKRGEGNR